MNSPRQENRRRQLQRLIDEAGSAADLCRIVCTPKSHISAILAGRRGVGDRLASKMEQRMHKAPGWMDLPPNGGYQHLEDLQAREVSHPPYIITPQTIEWGKLMKTELPAEFRVVLPDDSMAPEARAGSLVTFERDLGPRPGDFVLLVDDEGRWYMREYRESRPGTWEAHATGKGYEPLLSKRDGLRVMAVFTGIKSRRG